jgi:uncharacterized protein (TIGR02145 family)
MVKTFVINNTVQILWAVLLATVLSACTLQETPDSTGLGAITITAETVQEIKVANVPETKTTLSGVETHWVAGTDKIGIFSPEAKTTDGGETPVNNGEFTAQTSAKSSAFTGTMFWGEEVTHHFYAYYPYNSAYEGDQTAVPISLSSSQTQSAAGNTDHIGALDYMVATPDTVAYGGAVNFTFNHVFSMIEFQIKGSGDLTQVNLSGADPLACEGTIDLTQTPDADSYAISTSSTSNYVTVILESAASLSSGTAISVYVMVLPGAQNEDVSIALIIDGNSKILTKTPPTGGFARGEKYQVTLNTTDEGWTAAFMDARDDKIYPYITIGDQVWMTENLAYLPSVVGPATGSTTTAYYYVYGYNGTDVAAAKATDNYNTYGVLYNWPAAMNGAATSAINPSGIKGVCPDGWHLPSDAEWTQLEEYLIANGYNYDGTTKDNKIAKSMASNSGWETSSAVGAVGNTDYSEYRNKSGFTALPGGCRYSDGTFTNIGSLGHWWSSTQFNTDTAWYSGLLYSNSNVYGYSHFKRNGFSVRCVRD